MDLANSQILTFVISFFLGAGVGAVFYRYNLKRHPEKLEKWAAEIKKNYGG